MTPPEVWRLGIGAPDTPGWRVRVVPNLYPIVDAHEVVVLSPDHDRPFATLADAAAIEVLAIYASVSPSTSGTARVRVARHGRRHPQPQAGSRCVAPPPPRAGTRHRLRAARDAGAVGRARAFRPQTWWSTDLTHDKTLVLTSDVRGDDTSTWCPFASSSPFQLRVASMPAGAHFDPRVQTTRSCRRRTSRTRDALAQLAPALDDPPYNVVVHSTPPDRRRHSTGTWRSRFLSVLAGFEQATGLFVNTVDPAQAARALNEVRP